MQITKKKNGFLSISGDLFFGQNLIHTAIDLDVNVINSSHWVQSGYGRYNMKYRNPATHAAMLALEKNTLNRKHCDIVDTVKAVNINRITDGSEWSNTFPPWKIIYLY